VAVAGHRQHRRRRLQRDRKEEGQRAGGNAVAASRRTTAGRQAHRQSGSARVRRVRQGRDGGQVRGLDAQGVQGRGRVRGSFAGPRVPGRSVQVSLSMLYFFPLSGTSRRYIIIIYSVMQLFEVVDENNNNNYNIT